MPGASTTAARVPGSGIREIVNLVVERGGDVLRLEIGEPDFRTPAHVIEAAHRAALAGVRYTQSVGTLALREAISAKLERVNRLRCPPDRVIVCRHDLVLLADEVYDELLFEGSRADAASLDPERVVGLYSFSKTYAMTGWRVGYVAAPAWLAPALWTLQEPLISCVSEVSQAAALAALQGPQDCVASMREAYRHRRDLVVGMLGEAGIEVSTPHGAFYLMLPFAPGVDGRRAAFDLVEHGVSVAPGSAFGQAARSHARLSLASSQEVLREAIQRLVAWYRQTGGGASLESGGTA